MHAIEESNIAKLRDVFQDISFNSTKLATKRRRTTSCVTCSKTSPSPELNLRPSRIGLLDVIGNAYEFLIKNFASTSGKKPASSIRRRKFRN